MLFFQIISGYPLSANTGNIQVLGNILALAITTALQLYVDIKISDTSSRDNSLIVVNYVASTTSCSSKTLIDAVNEAILTSILTNTLHEYGFVNATANTLPSFISTPTSTPTLSPTSKYKEYPKVSPNLAPFCFVKVNDNFAYPFLFHFGSTSFEGDVFKPHQCNCKDGTGHNEA